MKRSYTLAVTLFSVLNASSGQETATLDLVNEAGFNAVEITADVPLIGAATDTTDLSGSIEVILDIDPSSDQVSELTVTSGDVTGTGITLARSALLGSFAVSATTLGATVVTPLPPGVVDPASGDFDAAQHTFTVNDGMLSGTFTNNLTFPPTVTPLTVDFGTAPVDGQASGNGNISLVLVSSTPTSKTYDVVVILPIAIDDAFPVPDTTLEVGVTATGTMKAAGSVTIPDVPENPYVAWTEANSIPGAAFNGDVNSDGVMNGIQWGLGLTVSENPFPFLLHPIGDQGATVDFEVTLPAGGSAADLTVVTTDDLESTPFTALASGAVSTGNPIPAGTTGTVTISLPKGTSDYVRLQVQEP